MRGKAWWHDRITGAFMSYWVYQHIGNLSPDELAEDETFQIVTRRRGRAADQAPARVRGPRRPRGGRDAGGASIATSAGPG